MSSALSHSNISLSKSKKKSTKIDDNCKSVFNFLLFAGTVGRDRSLTIISFCVLIIFIAFYVCVKDVRKRNRLSKLKREIKTKAANQIRAVGIFRLIDIDWLFIIHFHSEVRDTTFFFCWQ